jgi:hypothetical protein
MKKVVIDENFIEKIHVVGIRAIKYYAFWHDGADGAWVAVCWNDRYGFSNLTSIRGSIIFIEDSLIRSVSEAIDKGHIVYEFMNQKELAKWIAEHD